ncbi:unnamed protein product [Didymodactylos carnosus]|uniref:Uncharacterized protein n=1 Tax=Didymodactylos carnosus TaxID=1234261 RepID=A0A8S2V061_9BILA|nr:unnamed protein product [Didymodactylos carnosus]CAF4368320.1 unnamed protein product [Didymodactylos carnosus]
MVNTTQDITIVNDTDGHGGLFINAHGEIYLAESAGKDIKYPSDATSGTIVGVGLSQSSGAFVDQCDNIYVTDIAQHRIAKCSDNSCYQH